jgi:SNF5 / SMARCB1 / INI1
LESQTFMVSVNKTTQQCCSLFTMTTLSSTLVPIRIDVSSSLPSSNTAPAWRAVDTLLLDPTVAMDIPFVAHQWCADQARSVQLGVPDTTAIAEAILSPTTVSTVARQIATQWHAHAALAASTNPTTERSNSTTTNGNLLVVPIVIRFEWQGLCLCDEFHWDPSLSSTFNALSMAQSLAVDLNLPEDAVTALAIDIAEQVCVATTTNRITTGSTTLTATGSSSNVHHPNTVSSTVSSTTTGTTVVATAVPVSINQRPPDNTTLEREDDFVRAAITAATTMPAQGTTDPATAATAAASSTAIATTNNSSRTTAAWMVTPSSQATHVLHLASHYFPPRK